MARVPYTDPAEIPVEKRDLLDTLSETDVDSSEYSLQHETLNVYRAVGCNLALLEAFRAYASEVWEHCGLPPHEREVVILTTAYYADAAYEWHQHVRVAFDEGMTPEQILAISREEPDQLDPQCAALVSYVERFVNAHVDDETHERLAVHYDDETIVGVGMLSGCYLGLARLLQALDVRPESEFVGWELENL